MLWFMRQDNYHTYKELKVKLNTMSSFSDFLWFFAEEWKPTEPCATTMDNIVTQQVSRVPKRNRLIWFNKGKNSDSVKARTTFKVLTKTTEKGVSYAE